MEVTKYSRPLTVKEVVSLRDGPRGIVANNEKWKLWIMENGHKKLIYDVPKERMIEFTNDWVSVLPREEKYAFRIEKEVMYENKDDYGYTDSEVLYYLFYKAIQLQIEALEREKTLADRLPPAKPGQHGYSYILPTIRLMDDLKEKVCMENRKIYSKFHIYPKQNTRKV